MGARRPRVSEGARGLAAQPATSQPCRLGRSVLLSEPVEDDVNTTSLLQGL